MSGPRERPGDIAHAGFGGLIGVARADITPPAGIYARNWGAAEADLAASIHRPLIASVMTVRASGDGQPLVLASLDLGWWRTREDELHVRATLAARLGLGPERVIVHLSHTHSAPSICREDSGRPGGELIAPYLDHVRDVVAGAAARALATEREGRLDWGRGSCTLACQRDQRDPAGARFITGLDPESSADDTVLVGRVCGADGAVRAVLVNYACHPTSLGWANRAISPDFVGAMRDTIEQALAGSAGRVPGQEPDSDGVIAMFLQGASGDLAPRRQYAAESEIADANGRQLGHAALSTLAGMLPSGRTLRFAGTLESGAPLGIWTEAEAPVDDTIEARVLLVDVALKPMEDAATLRARLALALAAPGQAVTVERLTRALRVRRIVGDGDQARIEVWLWRIGGAFLVGQMNEAYSVFQRTLRDAMSTAVLGSAVVVLNHANGSCGYLPPRELYAEDLYQVWQTPFAAGTLEALTSATFAACVAFAGGSAGAAVGGSYRAAGRSSDLASGPAPSRSLDNPMHTSEAAT